MKIAIPTNGEEIKDQINKSFGRAKNFIIVDTDTLSFDIVENIQNMESSQGAGIQSAQLIVKTGADILITVNCGPKAYKVLSSAGVPIYLGMDGNILENVTEYKSGKLSPLNSANVEGHWA